MYTDYAYDENRGHRGHGGVAVLVRNNLNMVKIGNRDCSRIVAAVIRSTRMEILLIAVYMPTGTSQEKVSEFQETVDMIAGIIEEHGAGKMIIIGGDLNIDLTKDTHVNRKYMQKMMTDYGIIVPCRTLEGVAPSTATKLEEYRSWTTLWWIVSILKWCESTQYAIGTR